MTDGIHRETLLTIMPVVTLSMPTWIWVLAAVWLTESIWKVQGLSQDGCSLWHVRSTKNAKCEPGSNLDGRIQFDESKQLIMVSRGLCVTWDEESQRAEASYCLFIPCKADHTKRSYTIPTNISGAELNQRTCGGYHRRDIHCQKCIDGHGPALFYDGVMCADCSKHRHFWILNLLFQLSCVAITYLVVILLQIKGTSCPFNITITYSQLSVNILMISSRLHNKLVCRFGQKFAVMVLTIFGVLNLDFFNFLIPPLCIHPSARPIDVLLLDYVIAISPFIFTVFCYLCITLHDRNCHNGVLYFLSSPLKRCFQLHTNWNPKETILNTFATFLLCGYTKLLFVSVNLLVGVRSYNSLGEAVPNSTVLLYDPTIRFLHSKHIPYVVVALSIIFTFILVPPLLLLLYPTRIFRKCLQYCGFQNWGILHMVMDIYQGWYKDGTEGMGDYRPFSALYMLLRIGIGCTFIVILYTDNDGVRLDHIFGIIHILLGLFYYTARPYKKKWMNNADGFLLVFTGVILLLTDYHGHAYILVAIIASAVLALVYLYAMCKCLRIFCKLSLQQTSVHQ